MKVYYAHCIGLYNTLQETRDIQTLERLGFEVINPNTPETDAACDAIRAASSLPDPRDAVMEYFRRFALECDCIAFRALPDGSIPSGVALEITMFQGESKPVFELPSGFTTRGRTLAQTREYLREIGYR
jgi:hypothetical protein